MKTKTVVVTGASSGIGRAIALACAEAGYNVVVCYNKNADGASSVLHCILNAGGNAITVCADLTSQEGVELVKSETVKIFGSPYALINNAGISLEGLFCETDLPKMRKLFDANFWSAVYCTKSFAPAMIANGLGRIVNISSVFGRSGASCEAIYSASKAALVGLTQALAREFAPSGITVNAVLPGMIDTRMNEHLSASDKQDFLQNVPLGRMGTAQEVAHTVLHLLDSKSAYITAQSIIIDGGLLN